MNPRNQNKILIIEDTKMTAREYELVFPYQVTVVKSGAKAIKLFLEYQKTFDVIIVDDGIQSPIQTLKLLKHLTTTPLLFATSSSYLAKYASSYVSEYINIPFDVDAYNLAIKAALIKNSSKTPNLCYA